MTLLEDMIATIEQIKRDYPEPPVRFEMAHDVWVELSESVNVVAGGGPFGVFPGVPIVVSPTRSWGEWGPVFQSRRR